MTYYMDCDKCDGELPLDKLKKVGDGLLCKDCHMREEQ